MDMTLNKLGETQCNHWSYNMYPLEHIISAQIAKYSKLVILGLSQTTEKCQNGWSQLLDVPKMTQGLEKKHLNRCGQQLGTMVKEKPDIGLFVAILEVCHITINYFCVLGKRVVQQIKHHFYHAKLINMKLDNQENSLKLFLMLFQCIILRCPKC